MDISGTGISETVEEYENLRIGKEVDGETYLDADLGWFRSLVSGVVDEQKIIDPLVHQTLPTDWPLSRIDMLLRAVVRCGAYELMYRPDVPSRVIINEYLEISHAFFESEESRLLNAVLDRIARNCREEEFADQNAG